ncbi:uncharacterized protein [Oscarella lobularis]|uniref:uncharacterized protein isoform X2 n=1 Tax=Oscarella lobularis TaxID=121494 RepID=UPI0033134EEE
MCLTVNVKDVSKRLPRKIIASTTQTLNCNVWQRENPRPWVSIRDPRGKRIGVSGTEGAWVCLNTSLAIGGVYHCRANNSVWSEMSITNIPTNLTVDFREMTHSNETCFPEGSSVALCCTASADGDGLVTEILSSKGTVINSTIGVKNKICAVVSTPGVYTCIASTHHIFFERTLTVCMYPDDAFATSVIVSCVVIGALLLVLLFVLVKFRRRNFFSWRRNFSMRFDEKSPCSPRQRHKISKSRSFPTSSLPFGQTFFVRWNHP